MNCFKERVFYYLEGTLSYSFRFVGYIGVIEGYSDSNWISDSLNIESTSAYIFILSDSAISKQSIKQSIITRSTMEVELVVLDTNCLEAK